VGTESKSRREATRHFRNKMKTYLKAKFREIESNRKIKIIREMLKGKNDFKKVTSLRLIYYMMRRVI
jgi:hypothetical protein